MEFAQTRAAEAVAHTVALADQCVRCGLCLPHCPSYRVLGEEGESPRGRIAFARALARGTLAPAPGLAQHLDGCLACGVCETVCPSRVSYVELLVETRAARVRTRAARVAARTLRMLARAPGAVRLMRLLRPASRIARYLQGMPRVAAALEALAGLPPAARAPAGSALPAGTARGTVALFRGCVARDADADTHEAAARVLSRLGYDVVVPTARHCCGALALHGGATHEANDAVAEASRVFAASRASAIVMTASGCAQQVRAVARSAGIACDDVLARIASDDRADTLSFRRDARRVALLSPCTQAHSASEAAVRGSLARVPGLDVHVLPQQPRCCGAAGTYFAEQPQTARALRDERIEQILALDPALVLTTNIGCRIHLQAGLRARGSPIEVRHPIMLLADALE